MGAPEGLVQDILRYLERYGQLDFEAISTDTFVVRSRPPGAFAYEPVLRLPRELLKSYLDDMSKRYRNSADPFAEAMSLTQVNFLEELTTDHGDGINHVRAVGIRRGRGGRAVFFIDQDRPVWDPPGEPGDVLEWSADPPAP